MPNKMIYPSHKYIICELCGDEFLKMHSKQRFCSLSCAANSHKSKNDKKLASYYLNRDVLKVMKVYCQMHKISYTKFVEEAISQALLLKGIIIKSVIEKVKKN